ncbi:MAG: PTS sugar transporter subunit IIA [Pseudomonadota bacterium]|uniref:PTS sugar transporter subunit IIA n=1 Tax=Phenylobacterium sp. TaxID=1871053 RepID=UPI0025D2B5EB|nr:PTS sugar transporter subunit IIA [Phenylobacterium sp.]MBT9469975.1 PTS sugar transporter subunit IIA [Phenylobacterium sp.]
MLIRDILTERDIVLDVLATDKAAVLARAAILLARTAGADQQTIGEALVAREQTGSTGFGSGVAIPHALVGGISAPTACLLLLGQPVAYDAIDERPVDIALGLLWPKHDTRGFLPGLAQIARVMRSGRTRKLLRTAPTAAAALAYLDQKVEASAPQGADVRLAGQDLYLQYA